MLKKLFASELFIHFFGEMLSVLLLLQPVFDAVYGLLFFNEKLMISQIVGAIIILVSVYIFKRVESPKT
jgi:drug/metabolite transporter (DMT)-like permease